MFMWLLFGCLPRPDCECPLAYGFLKKTIRARHNKKGEGSRRQGVPSAGREARVEIQEGASARSRAPERPRTKSPITVARVGQ